MEIWKDIKGYEDAYQVSSYGRVKAKDRLVNATFGSQQLRRGQDIKAIQMPNGYYVVGLWKDGKSKNKYVHRLVAEHFLINENNLPEVNHKDENKANNSLDNLEWCEHRYNINYGSARRRISQSHINLDYPTRVIQIKNGVQVAIYKTASEAQRKTGIDASAIRKVCLGRPKFHTAGGYQWKEIEI